MNYYPFHIGDYASATRHLSWDEDAAYRRLLDVYYTSEKPLPIDFRAVCRLVLATTDAQREAVRVVLEEFFQQSEEGWRNARADIEIDAMREKQEKQREKARKRWDKPAPERGNAPAMPQHGKADAVASGNDADAMPPTPTPTPTPTPNTEPNGSEEGARSCATRFDVLACPAGINLDAWTDWVLNRRKRKKPISQRAAHEQWRLLAGLTPLQQAACIAASIRNDWTGLFPEKVVSIKQTGNDGGQRSTRDRSLVEDLTDRSWAV